MLLLLSKPKSVPNKLFQLQGVYSEFPSDVFTSYPIQKTLILTTGIHTYHPFTHYPKLMATFNGCELGRVPPSASSSFTTFPYDGTTLAVQPMPSQTTSFHSFIIHEHGSERLFRAATPTAKPSAVSNPQGLRL